MSARRSRPPLAALAAAAAVMSTLSSCSFLGDRLFRPRPEAPVNTADSYLERGGPEAGAGLGKGEEQLLTRFQAVLEQKHELEKKHAELVAEIDAVRTTLASEKGDRDEQTRLRVGAEAEADRLRREKSDQELKILHLQLQVAELQRTRLQLEIASIERQIEYLVQQQAGNAATPPPGMNH